MKGIEKITARIETDSRAEVEQILREAEEKAAQIRADYQSKAAAAAEAAAETGRQAAASQYARLESAAHMEAKTRLLSAKQACVDETFALARKKLLELPDGQYADLLARMAVRASKTGREEILLNARDRDRVGVQVAAKANALLAQEIAPDMPAEVKGTKAGDLLGKVVTGANALIHGTAMLTLSPETREMEGGLTLRDGKVEVNCAFETELRVLREEMAAEVAGILFA